MIQNFAAVATVAIWVRLAFWRGAFWRVEIGPRSSPEPDVWPAVIAIVPARNEAASVGDTVRSLSLQDYPGAFSIVLVDDQSEDATVDVARLAAAEAGREQGLEIVAGVKSPGGWTGKLWAMRQGVDHAARGAPDFLLFTDADTRHAPGALRSLVAEAVAEKLALSSLMIELRCASPLERALVPAFVFFFRMLYPFRWVNRADQPVAAAAGGVMLVSRTALEAAGGLEKIQTALIDDCALARLMKARGPIRLSMTKSVASGRAYATVSDARAMISRSAYAQLRYSPTLLGLTLAGMALTFLAPVLLALFANGFARLAGVAAWAAMALVFQPTLRFYRRSPLWGLALPAVALAYLGFTIDSAWLHARGRGGMWKGRAHNSGGVAA